MHVHAPLIIQHDIQVFIFEFVPICDINDSRVEGYLASKVIQKNGFSRYSESVTDRILPTAHSRWEG